MSRVFAWARWAEVAIVFTSDAHQNPALQSLVRALPPGIPVAVESPTLELAKTVDALERARRAIAGVRRVLESAGLDRAGLYAARRRMGMLFQLGALFTSPW